MHHGCYHNLEFGPWQHWHQHQPDPNCHYYDKWVAFSGENSMPDLGESEAAIANEYLESCREVDYARAQEAWAYRELIDVATWIIQCNPSDLRSYNAAHIFESAMTHLHATEKEKASVWKKYSNIINAYNAFQKWVYKNTWGKHWKAEDNTGNDDLHTLYD